MTVIAYRDGVIAVDSQLTYHETKAPSGFNKLTKLRDGSFIAVSGDLCKAMAFVRRLDAGLDRPSIDPAPMEGGGGAARLDLKRNKVIVYEEGGYYELDTKGFYAWGIGAPIAMGAMDMGATAEQAVNAACRISLWCDFPIRTNKD
jgi:hypothetical protein